MVEYSNSGFVVMLKLLQNSQSAIQSLSTWCLKHHEHYKSIIMIWLNAIRKMNIKKRLTLFYLANHVIQYSKKKNYKFVDKWKIAIQKAIPYVRDEKIQFQISRIIKIWKKRGIYDVGYLADLTGLLTTPIQKLKLTNSVQEIQIRAIKAKIRYCAKLEQINDSKMKNLTEAILPFTNKESIQNMLKDQTLSHEVFNNNMSNIESYIKCLKQEIIDRAQLIDSIEVAKSYCKKKNREMKIVAQEYFNYTKRIKLLKSRLEVMVGSMPIENPMPLPHIYVPPPSASSVSIVDLNIHKINDNTVLNSDKNTMNSSMTAINYIKSNTTPDKYTSVREPYDPASVSFPAIENQDQQSLTNKFPNDAPSLPPDETSAYFAFPNQTKMNNNNKSSTYSTSSYEAYEHTQMSSSHQIITSEFSINMVSPTNLSSLVNESSMPASHVLQTDCGVTLLSDSTTNGVPASSLLHEKISYQNTHIINKTDGDLGIDHCVLPSKIIDRDVTVSPKTINETSGIEHRNFNSSTHPTGKNSLTISVDADCRAFCGIRIPPSPPNLLIEAVSSPLKDNLEIVDMDLSDDDVNDYVESVDMNLRVGDEKSKSHQDQKHSVLLPSPLLLMPYYQQNVPDVTYQWKQTSQPWNNDKPNFNENQSNIKQSDQWKHPKQWEQDKRFSNFVHNHPHSLWPQHVQKIQSKEDLKPKLERRINIWASRDPRNFIPYSRPTSTQSLEHVLD